MSKSKDINIKETLIKSYELFKSNLKLFLSMSAILFLFSFIQSAFSIWYNRIENITLKSSLLLPSLFINLIFLYVGARVIPALMFAVRYRLHNHRITLRECFRDSKGLVWKFAYAVVTLVVITLIPGLMIGFAQVLPMTLFWKIVLTVTGILVLVFLHTRYGFLPYVRVFEPDADKPLDYSRDLVSKAFYKCIVILFLPLLVTTLFSLINSWFINPDASMFTGMVFIFVRMLVNIVTWPVLISATIITFFNLEKIIDKDKYVLKDRKFGSLSKAESLVLLNKLMDVWEIGKDMQWYPLKETKAVVADYCLKDMDIKAVENLVWEKYPQDIYILTDADKVSGKCIPAFNLELKHTGHNKFFFNKSLEWVIYISEEGHIVFGGMELIGVVKELQKTLV